MQLQTAPSIWDKASVHPVKSQTWPIESSSRVMRALLMETDGLVEWVTDQGTARNESEYELEQTFYRHVEQWREERGPSSSARDMAMRPSYQRIIGIGPKAIPLILRELENNPDHWFWALNMITGYDPVPEQSRGRIREMAAAWLRWGQEHGYYRPHG